jgi:hypothetical protein
MKIINLFRKVFNPDRPPKNVMATMGKIAEIAFPRGNEQISEEAEMLYAVLNKRVSEEDLKGILVTTKPLFYLKNCRQKGAIISINNSIFADRSKTYISETDIKTILKFYENYFEFYPAAYEISSSESNAPNILTHVNLYDREGYFWGCVDIADNKWYPKLTETGIRSVYQTVLIGAVIAAKRNISDEDRSVFSNIAALPKGEWTEVHYNRFAFLFAVWIKCYKDFDESIPRTAKLNQVKILLKEFNIKNEEIARNQFIVNIFNKCLVNL